MNTTAYPAYQASGVMWLGEIPAGWQVRKLRHLAPLATGHTPSRQHPEYWVEEECTIPWFTLADVGYLRDERNVIIKSTSHKISPMGMVNSAARLLPAGTVILSRTASVGFSGILAMPAAVSQDFAAWTCGPAMNRNFLLFCLRAMKPEFWSLMMGSTHQTIYMPDIEAFRVPVPSPAEQTAIAAFLDRETGKIDALVAEQERLMALLKEKRQAVISRAVTKGLGPDAPMRDSGVAWLGEVPAHWEVKRIKHLIISIEQGWSPQCDGSPVASNDEWGVLKVGCVNGGIFDSTENKSLPSGLTPQPELGICAGDVLISRANTRDLVGSAACATRDHRNLMLCDKLYRLRLCPTTFRPKLLATYLGSDAARNQIELAATGASQSMVNIAQSLILELPIPLPPSDEQDEVLSFIEHETEKLNILTAEAGRAITVLKERRAALISAAVTGKVDIRGLPPAIAEAA